MTIKKHLTSAQCPCEDITVIRQYNSRRLVLLINRRVTPKQIGIAATQTCISHKKSKVTNNRKLLGGPVRSDWIGDRTATIPKVEVNTKMMIFSYLTMPHTKMGGKIGMKALGVDVYPEPVVTTPTVV